MLTAPVTPVPCSPFARQVIVLGGTFDPPHQGHVKLAVAARDAIAKDAPLLLVPAATSPFKVGASVTTAEHRVAMARLAVRGVPEVYVWTDEVDRAAKASGPSYTVDTLERLQQEMPRTRVILLIGADQAVSFHKWRSAERLLAHVRVLLRDPCVDESTLRGALRTTGAWSDVQVSEWAAKLVPLAAPLHDARSTDIRTRIAEVGVAGLPSDWLHADVARYIHEHELYEA